jgi:NADH:ubiquinone oxidoreductase subunit 6 (subunit J)
MNRQNKLILAQLILNGLLALGICLYAGKVFCSLKIRFNISTRVRQIVIYLSVIMKLILFIVCFMTGDYEVKGWRLYYRFLLEQMFFTILTMLFVTIIGSLRLTSQIKT